MPKRKLDMTFTHGNKRLKPLHLPGYNYAGPGTSDFSKKPVNAIDALCRQHDLAMKSIGSKYSYTLWNSADEVLLAKLEALKVKSIKERVAKKTILTYFETKKATTKRVVRDWEIAEIVERENAGYYDWSQSSPADLKRYKVDGVRMDNNRILAPPPTETVVNETDEDLLSGHLEISKDMVNTTTQQTFDRSFSRSDRRRKKAPFTKRQLAYMKAAIFGAASSGSVRNVDRAKISFTQGQAGLGEVAGMTATKFDAVLTSLGSPGDATEARITDYAMKLHVHNPNNFPVHYQVFLAWPKIRLSKSPVDMFVALDADYATTYKDYDPNRINQMPWDNPEFSQYYATKHMKAGMLPPQNNTSVLYRKKHMNIMELDWDADTGLGLSACEYHPMFTHFFFVKVWGDFGFDENDVNAKYMSTSAGSIGILYEEFYKERLQELDNNIPYWQVRVGSDYPTTVTAMEVVADFDQAAADVGGN